jgi:hypothetical protein
LANVQKQRIKQVIYLYKKKGIKMKLTKEQVLGIVRHTLTFIGGIVIARGLVDETLVTECIGGVLTLNGSYLVYY